MAKRDGSRLSDRGERSQVSVIDEKESPFFHDAWPWSFQIGGADVKSKGRPASAAAATIGLSGQDQDKLLYQYLYAVHAAMYFPSPERTQKIPGMAPIPLRSRLEAIQYTSQILGVSHSKGSGQPLATWAAT
ncbi:hypothetical protein HYALB_00006291 [Hymenoscyphus albidus]|uniref:Uncharacterized protein n=1 Tax=Hymenoscyphus albidus TaxID=595503 RepID=A0A9N9M5Z5_9HELO|nr:hypothetical protein HYALB_00006291 [Hymenoscyphus albidus]